MLHDNVETGSSGRIWDEHDAEEIAGLFGDVIGKGERGADNVLVQKIDVVAVWIGGVVVKRQVSGKHGIENDAAAPNINCAADVEALADDELWGGVAGTAAACLHEIIGPVLETVCKTKISDDDVAVAVEEEVFELEVAVDNFLLVNVPDAGDELRKEFCGVTLAQIAMGEDMVKELATGSVLEDDANVLVCLYDVVEADDVGVLEDLGEGA